MTRTALLIGRPNAGKSSIFNRLTGASAHVGNFPGVTVDLLEGTCDVPNIGEVTLIDLPGVYTLDNQVAEGTDEHITFDFLANRAAKTEPAPADAPVLIQVLDATQLAVGLKLTRQLRELFAASKLLVVCNQTDLLEREACYLDTELLTDLVGAPVIGVSARDPASKISVLSALSAVIQSDPPGVFAGADFSERANNAIKSKSNESADTATENNTAANEASLRKRTDRIDSVLLHPWLGPILFFLIMAALFASVYLIADPVASVCDAAVQAVGEKIKAGLGEGTLSSLLVEGVLGGAGTVAAFLPQIIVLIAAMEILEGSGYLARASFLIDRVFRSTGLGGKAFVPFLTAHACAVPAIATTRVLRDPKERLTAILVLPLMTCSARLPVYSLIVTAFFAGSTWTKTLVTTALYFIGLISGLVASAIFRRSLTKGRALPLVLEMPLYRRPMLRSVLARCGRESVDFLKRVGTVIVAFSVVLWVMLKVEIHPPSSPDEPAIERSVAAAVGKAFEPITKPIGFDWRINVGLVGSFGARELMVSTLGVTFGVETAGDDPGPLAKKIAEAKHADGSNAYSAANALSLLAFFVLACQCMSTISAVRRETKSLKWPLFLLGYTYAAAYVSSLIVFQVARLFGL